MRDSRKTFYIKLLLIIFLHGMMAFALRAQTYNFDRYTVKDGLIQSNVNCILQDKYGYMWFGTDGGLSRFDGRKFINYSTFNGLAETAVTCLFEDQKGRIWIGHALGKISLLEGGKISEFKTGLTVKPTRIMHISVDRDGFLWFSTFGAGALRISPETFQTVAFGIPEKLNDNVISTFTSQSGKTWFVTDIGIKYREYHSDSFVFFKPEGLPFYEFTCMAEDTSGGYWLGTTTNGLVYFHPEKKQLRHVLREFGLKDQMVVSVLTDKQQNIWAGTWGGGLIYYNHKNLTTITESSGLPGTKVRCLYLDQQNQLWCGIPDKGVAYFKGFRFIHYDTGSGFKSPVVNDIEQDSEGQFWFATNNGIMLMRKGHYGELSYIDAGKELGDDMVTSLCYHKGFIYASTFKGDIGVYASGSGKFIKSLPLDKSLINDIYVDQNEVLWIAGSGGLYHYNFLSGKMTEVHELNLFIIKKIFPDKGGKYLWLGCRQSGLIRFDGKHVEHFGEKQGLMYNSATSFTYDKQGKLWVGTEGGGLYRQDGNRFVKFSNGNGLSSPFITLLTCDNYNRIWVGTNAGLNRIDSARRQITYYTREEGFQAIETINNSIYYENGGRIFFGTVDGVTIYNPAFETSELMAPLLYLNAYKTEENLLPVPDEINLTYNKNNITFYFDLISYQSPSKSKIKYKLEGYDDNWQTATGIDKIVFSHLPTGQYTLRMIACSAEGVCQSEEKSVNIKVIPAIYNRTWFRLMLAAILLLSFQIFLRIRTGYLRRSKVILEKQVKDRTLEIEQKNTILTEANQVILSKNKEITDSINYARRIQEAILPSTHFFRQYFQKAFILYYPKDIVSGDFYWFSEVKNNDDPLDNDILISVADCTGHGVPGAFMCMIGNSQLNQIIKEEPALPPSQILDKLHSGILKALKQGETETRDGMDIGLCRINRKRMEIQFSGAMRSLYIFRGKTYCDKFGLSEENNMEEFKADKYSIGGLQMEDRRSFTNYVIQYYPGDSLYLTTDGYADQFGGSRGKKLMTRNFKNILKSIQKMNMLKQFHYLEDFYLEWKGMHEQVDDVLVIGIRF